MKINYKKNHFKMMWLKGKSVCLAALILCGAGTLNAQTYTFTPAGATGSAGPTQAQVNAAYLATNLNGSVISTAGIQTFTVPANGVYSIDAYGAIGGGNIAGLGARAKGDFTLAAGAVLKIVVAQQGGSQDGTHGSGGGGSYITYTNNTALVVVIPKRNRVHTSLMGVQRGRKKIPCSRV